MIHQPTEALQALTRLQRLDPGDLVLTGTPVGTALSAPPRPVQLLSELLPAAMTWRLFFSTQAKNPNTCGMATLSRWPWPPTTTGSIWAGSARS